MSVVVPWRPDGADRDVAWDFVRQWWASAYPQWRVVTGGCGPGEWVKARAVCDALTRIDAGVLIVADADVICDDVASAVRAVEAGAPWAVPHRALHRLTRAGTRQLLSGGDCPRRRGPDGQRLIGETYTGMAGGGMVVLPRATYELVPLDARYRGWGQEDASWGLALTTLAGPGWRGTATMWHLWHPPAPRRSRSVGSLDSLNLYRRYRQSTRPELMRELLGEPGAHAC